MQLTYTRSTRALVAGFLARHIEPSPPLPPSVWAAAHAIAPDGDYKGERIDLTRTPHLIEPLDLLGPESAHNELAVMKSVQSGFTTMLLCSVGHLIDRDPCDMMIVEPTDGALTALNSTKLTRFIEGSEVLKKKVYPQTARSSAGSTTYEKKFPRGALNLVLASSPAALRLKTIKVALCDEVDEYEEDLDGQGDPLQLVAGRQEMFLASGTWKRAYISTPTVKGVSKIEKLHAAGDQRRWRVECPHCASRFTFEWHAPLDAGSFGLKFKKTYPHEAHYVTPCCGSIIEAWQKDTVYRTGRWEATAPGAGKYPSYHFDGLASPFVPWNEIAKKFVDAGDDPTKLKAFWNLQLGMPYDMAGDAPDHEMLMQRREDYEPERIPPSALLVTAFADVQMRGIYVEVVAWAPDQQSWTIFADYLDGPTTDADGGAFAELTKFYAREWADGYGHKFPLDEIGIDSGYRTDVVYEWTRRHHGSKATKGIDGWGKVPLGTATDQDIDYRGRKIKGGAKLRLMGTWPLKSKFYTYAALTPIIEGLTLIYPSGYCHFGRFLDENYFRQITAEYLDEESYRGRPRKRWKVRAHRDNHFLDCRIGNLALAHPYFMSFTAGDWALRAKARGIPADLQAPDLFTPKEFHSPAAGAKAAHDAGEGASASSPSASSPRSIYDRLRELNKDT